MKEEKRIYLPKEVEAKRNWIQGYGMKEAIQSLILFSFFAPVGIIVFLVLGTTELLALTLLIIGIFSVSMCIKNQGMSIFDFTMRILRYNKEQKFYPYKPYKRD